ncbi:Endophilin-B1 [Holothuria leucospilota]|uniref:Endophilin-B1 n=1 Tax=Holothuria leucospilota TaxID=206669 RepID=A0A9Q1HBV6_HOLLE|nr:Endophilin-B1 [Holothuria leucospilota]
MDKLKGIAADAGTFLTRTKQYTEEKIGNAEKTELDAHFENLLQRADRTRVWTEKILARVEAVLQPNPNVRMEDYVNVKLDRRPRDRENNLEFLGDAFLEAGSELGPGTQYGAALTQCGQMQRKMGQLEREFLQSSMANFVLPLKKFLDEDMKTIQKERKSLDVKRLDLDASKGKLRKSKSMEAQRNVNIEEVIRTAEAELRVAQTEFDRQYEITKLLLEGISTAHSTHLERLKDFVDAQQTYYSKCNEVISELQRQMGNFPGSLGGIMPPTTSAASVTPKENPSQPQGGRRKAKALYDYDASDPSELSLLADEIIQVYSVPGMDSDWMMGVRGTQEGKVPVPYIELL